MPTTPARNPTPFNFYFQNWEYNDRYDWYNQHGDIVGNAVGLLAPLVLRTGGVGSPPQIYRNFAPIVVTVDVNIKVTNPGAGGTITMQVFPIWGGVIGNNIAFEIQAIANNSIHLYTQIQVFSPPGQPDFITVQWEILALPAGAIITVVNDLDALLPGSHYYVRYARNQLFGQARI